jgi:hypothetical protein
VLRKENLLTKREIMSQEAKDAPEMDKQSGRWEFLQDDTHEWRWRCYYGKPVKLDESEKRFSNLIDCINDARRNGYTPDSTKIVTKPRP